MSARPAAAHALAGALLSATPAIAFIAANGYPKASPEALIVCGAAALGGAALFGTVRLLGTTPGALALGAAALLCVDLLDGGLLSTPALAIVGAACLGLALLLRRHVALVISAAAAAFLAATLAIPGGIAEEPPARAPGAGRASAAPALPVVLHLILDEHIGLDGLPSELPETPAFARGLAEAYVGQGFRLYAGAYSQYFDTRNSLANLFNFTSQADPWANLAQGRRKPYVLSDSAYFRHLSALGYRLSVYQSDHIDLCQVQGVAYARCRGYRANSIGALAHSELATTERARFIANSLAATSSALEQLRAVYARLRHAAPALALPAWTPGVSRVGPLAVLPVLDELERDLRSAVPGEAYVAHLLIPHYPYVFDASCRPHASIERWLYNVPPGTRSNSAAGRAERYRQYFAQIRCQQAQLGRLFDAMKRAGVWDRAIVIVHGDHGSRIVVNEPTERNAERVTRADFNDSFSTLFAARRPGLAAGIAGGSRPLQELLGEALGVPLPRFAARVYLLGPEGAPLGQRELAQFR